MAYKETVTKKTSENVFSTMGTIFPTKTGKEVFKGKFDKFGVKSIDVTLNDGKIYTLDAESFVLITPKTIETKNGKMEIKEVCLVH